MSKLNEIRERLEAATPGPWKSVKDVLDNRHPVHRIGSESIGTDVAAVTRWGSKLDEADAEFIANAPTDVARLLDALEAALKLAEEWRYKGEFGWGAWQEGQGPDPEGYALDGASADLRAAISDALGAES